MSFTRIGLVVCAVTLVLVPSGGHAAVTFGATCSIALSVSFTPPLKFAAASTTMSFSTASSTCAGTEGLARAFIGGTATASMSCAEIVVLSGLGTLTYASAPPGDFRWLFEGDIAGGQLTLTPGTGLIVGAAALATNPPVATSCSAGVATARMIGTLTFSDPSLTRLSG